MKKAKRLGVAAVAGRRIDAEGATPARFPSAAVPLVHGDVTRLYVEHEIGTVVASAACGADIVALEAALELGLDWVIVLPFAASRFRETSVVDRGGDWGQRFDRLLNQPRATVIVLPPLAGSDDAAYAEATRRILSEAESRAPAEQSPFAIAVWDGAPRSGTDATKDFLDRAKAAGMWVCEVISAPGEAAKRYLAGAKGAAEHALDLQDALLLSDPVQSSELTREVARRFLHADLPMDAATLQRTWKACKRVEAFGLARRILHRCRLELAALPSLDETQQKLALKLQQEQALCTSKDPDLSAAMRHDWALQLLKPSEHLGNEEHQGIAGGIYKRRWEWDGSRASLELALWHYRSGLPPLAATGKRAGFSSDGYLEINCAFVLELLASLVRDEATAENYRAEARALRSDLTALTTESKWAHATRAEAYLGLGRSVEAQAAIVKYLAAKPDAWELETTLRQLVRLGHLLNVPDAQLRPILAEGLRDRSAEASSAPLLSLLLGRVGLALSGGGFRASLYHLGVLACLAECGLLRHVEVLSCVSGGSIVGALYYQALKEALQSHGEALERDDYIRVVEKVIERFRQGVHQNVRTGLLTNYWNSVAIVSGDDQGYAAAVAAAFHRAFYREDGSPPAFLDELGVIPREGPRHFHPGRHNWTRKNKVPTLVLNAATLNTGHGWQFTARSMGESPFTLRPAVDSNPRLRRMNHAREKARRVSMPEAVAASACVPGLFAPLQLDNLYAGFSVRLVDGGVFDNQGTSSLLEQDCQVLVVSDAAGQLFAEGAAQGGHVTPLMRSVGIFQERIRQTGYEALLKRQEAGQVRHVAYTHLTQGLGVPAVDWIGCEDPLREDEQLPANLRREAGSGQVAHELQRCLAKMRTDLDVFSDIECAALMASGYISVRPTLEPLVAQLRALGDPDVSRAPHPFWFSELMPLMQATGSTSPQYEHLLSHLDAGERGFGRLLPFDAPLKSAALCVTFLLGLGAALLAWKFKDATLLTVGGLALAALGFGLHRFAGKVGRSLSSALDLATDPTGAVQAPLYRYVVALLLTLAARFAVERLDRRYLARGALETLRGSGPPAE
ncbi:MAG TPA: patatin-like phospholipase family protein [Polyangiaceae bacterium]|jgi:predicted acylesterase/phospholipase RssA|nr:patatin-like phospholipase family protein [Polyangiaceae bacterium]